MRFDLANLPFERDALEPFISARTIGFHYDEHHRGYIEKLKGALDDDRRDWSLDEIVRRSSGHVFNLAAQVWNHDFYWQSLSPEPEAPRGERLSTLIDQSFGSLDRFNSAFAEAAIDEFGSGWTWLVFDPASERLRAMSTTDAVNPLPSSLVPLLTLDVWEHAYYLDYQNDRKSYIDAFLGAHVNWAHAERQLERHDALSAASRARKAS